jgi:hypothetical protein
LILKIKKSFESQRGRVEKDRGLEGWRVGDRRQKTEDRRQERVGKDRGLEG